LLKRNDRIAFDKQEKAKSYVDEYLTKATPWPMPFWILITNILPASGLIQLPAIDFDKPRKQMIELRKIIQIILLK
jgi:hypothetical protein